ncbi:MAG: DUF5816 domain-containing protein, partial [Halobacteriota archaeon]
MELEAAITDEDESVYVDRSEFERGSEGPFFVVYETEEATTRWGFLCSNCETFDNAMDTMGRIECNV